MNYLDVEHLFLEIVAERNRQDQQWGGPEHDDKHRPWDFFNYIRSRCQNFVADPVEQHRKQLIQIAALAVAAIESIDRKQATKDVDK